MSSRKNRNFLRLTLTKYWVNLRYDTKEEICGDRKLNFKNRLLYLVRNFCRNVNFKKNEFVSKRFCSQRQPRTSGQVSPSRALIEAFLCKELPRLLPVGEVRVLDIGCGAGRLSLLLKELGYRGTYVGIDVADVFEQKETPGFDREFIIIDAHRYNPEKKFDLIVSISTLEHICNDTDLIPKLSTFLTAGGLQLHFVPSSWALFLYFWHGYRQYTLASLSKRFDTSRTEIFNLGGFASFLLHLSFISVWEIFLRVNLRKKFPALYGRLLNQSLAIDRYIPIFSAFHAVVSRAAPSAQK